MTLVVGVGQPLAGDDGVGRAVARRLRALGIDAEEADGGAALLALLAGEPRAILVDAAVGLAPPGTVVTLAPGELPPARRSASSHGFSVPEAVALARALGPLEVQVVAVAIAPPGRLPAEELSPEVAAAVPIAAARVAALCRGI
jgi:hydrogenase maturation protease